MSSTIVGAFQILFERQNAVEEILKKKGLVTEADLITLKRKHLADTWTLLELVAEEINELKPWISMNKAIKIAKILSKENTQ